MAEISGAQSLTVRPWVPDDEIEGPVVGAALDRWVARQASAAALTAAAEARSRSVDGFDGDGGQDGVDGQDGDGGIDPATAWSAGRSGTGMVAYSGRAFGGGIDGAEDEALGRSAAAAEARPRRPVSRWRAWLRRSCGRGAELWVPEPLRGARVDPGRRGAMALLLVAALAAAITAAGVWRDRPEARPVATVSAGSVGLVSADPPASSGAASPSSVADGSDSGTSATMAAVEIVVSVTGLVVRPGVVTLPGNARVADAIAAAGGLTDGADVTGLNLAAKLTDGASVVVGATGASVQGPSGATDASDGKAGGADPSGASGGGVRVDLNVADADELDTLPGVGPVMAGNIVAWREANGRFTSVDQLQEISGIGPARFAQLSELVTVS